MLKPRNITHFVMVLMSTLYSQTHLWFRWIALLLLCTGLPAVFRMLYPRTDS